MVDVVTELASNHVFYVLMTNGEILVYDLNVNKKTCSSIAFSEISIFSTFKIQWDECLGHRPRPDPRLLPPVPEGIPDAESTIFTSILGVQHNM